MESEIEILRRRVAELEAAGGNKEKAEIIKEAVKEHIEVVGQVKKENLFEPAEIKAHAERIASFKKEGEEHSRQMTELLQMAQDKGVLNAISVIKEIGDPHLEDDFHDALVNFFQGINNL